MKKIGIIGAMDVEVERLKADMTVTRQITKDVYKRQDETGRLLCGAVQQPV